ncbi:MAG TPA: hypothetical protein VMR06_18100 [Dokdonella sp.]|uniref:hypothetical protein n=1 Tax=Dokdonella sp. TaxID=2291710 RepID=UPI002B96834C|nr:hypothetical protein [Dokdonella sp.]HUD43901.1 hypothetical protein [Dokdonella sp.]
MLLAPLSLPPAVVPVRSRSAIAAIASPRRRAPSRTIRPPLPEAPPAGTEAGRRRRLLLWALAGLLIVMLVPAARPGPLLGWSLPFWLVLAPAINLAWLARRRWLAALGTGFRAVRLRRPAARRIARRGSAQPPGQRSATRSRRARSAASSPDRSSNS